MHAAVYAAIAVSAVFGVVAPRLAVRLPPRGATWLLAVGGLVVASVSTGALALLSLTLAARIPSVDALTHWSGTTLSQHTPVPVAVGAAAVVALGVRGAQLCLVTTRRAVALREAFALAAALPYSGTELAVVDQPGLHAYAVPGLPGRILVSADMLQTLDAPQRRAVLAHERAHLAHHHHLHHAAAALASAANPFLRGLPAAVALATERWADEDAAAVTSRAVMAQALQHVAAGGTPAPVPLLSAVLAAAGGDVGVRLTALRAAPVRPDWRAMAVLAGLVAAVVGAGVDAARDTEQLFELAQHAYRIGVR